MGKIDWIPIAGMPAAFKDGRELLLWDAKRQRGPHHFGFYAGAFGAGADYWLITGSSQKLEPTHFAEINAPDEVTVTITVRGGDLDDMKPIPA